MSCFGTHCMLLPVIQLKIGPCMPSPCRHVGDCLLCQVQNAPYVIASRQVHAGMQSPHVPKPPRMHSSCLISESLQMLLACQVQDAPYVIASRTAQNGAMHAKHMQACSLLMYLSHQQWTAAVSSQRRCRCCLLRQVQDALVSFPCYTAQTGLFVVAIVEADRHGMALLCELLRVTTVGR